MTQSAAATSATRVAGAFERLPPPSSLLLVAGAVGLLVGSLRSDVFAQLTVQGLALGAVYGSLALALVLVYRATRVVNFAQGELAMATTYIAYQLIKWGLSYWEAFFATLAIAFVQRPRLLLLDEPSLGLAPVLVAELFRIVRDLNETEGLTVLVVEQNAHLALQAADAGYVLEAGRVALSGTTNELRSDDSVRRSYLGY